MSITKKVNRCFIIGPMKDHNRLGTIKREIIEPILRPYDYEIITPDLGNIGNIMNQVLLNLEQADILIADITGSNPNVMYELGIYHSFGKPCLVIKDENDSENTEQTPFDIKAYRFELFSYNDPQKYIDKIRARLVTILEKLDKTDWFSNPVTDFYLSPLAEIPTAVGLWKNYQKNFIKEVLPEMFQRNENDDNFKLKVKIEIGIKDDKPIERELSTVEMERLSFELLLPEKMVNASHNYISGLKSNKTFPYLSASILKRTRKFNLHYRLDTDGNIILADIPTILSTLYESIRQRRNINTAQIETNGWEILEAQELERFATKIRLFTNELQDKHPECRGKVKVVEHWGG